MTETEIADRKMKLMGWTEAQFAEDNRQNELHEQARKDGSIKTWDEYAITSDEGETKFFKTFRKAISFARAYAAKGIGGKIVVCHYADGCGIESTTEKRFSPIRFRAILKI